MTSMAAGDEAMAVEDMNPQRREQGPRRQRLRRWSTGAPMDADGTAGQQGARSWAQSKKPDLRQK